MGRSLNHCCQVTVIVIALLTASSGTTTTAGEIVAPAKIQAAIARSLPFIEDRGNWWIEEKKCVSCHRVAFMPWSFRDAQKAGVAVTDAKINELTLKSFKETGGKNNADGLSQILLARDPSIGKHQEEFEKLAKILVETQQADGSWKPAGQLPGQKRPLNETTHVSTMWNSLALASMGDGEAYLKASRKGFEFSQKKSSAKSVEWYLVRMLVERQFSTAEKAQSWRARLLKLQNKDGGWPWLAGRESDALATGQVLYALSIMKTPVADPAIQRAQAWLVNSQQTNGSWRVRGTKAKKQENFEETSIYWGTAWATIGLSRTLPADRK